MQYFCIITKLGRFGKFLISVYEIIPSNSAFTVHIINSLYSQVVTYMYFEKEVFFFQKN